MQQQLMQLTGQKAQQEQQDRQFDQSMQQQKMDIEAAKAVGQLMKTGV